ncbi:hypothetical protein P170DRAFT_475050 [Aspergillus steynii IBT 23096]|uniref:Uncharacterized protein n=1 Tax=Aspergillus steynii IBT 23096 TaxID=1392250 RepID=A0A2I2G746_9EURO|nr:uncharacterized protein P170DRAFT_475050 [Aspergillus steynii IBT 23096]PLB48702.1 hypothetical protein P170DRAFT_475050 [Aspergillus steynii IBT 23096]
MSAEQSQARQTASNSTEPATNFSDWADIESICNLIKIELDQLEDLGLPSTQIFQKGVPSLDQHVETIKQGLYSDREIDSMMSTEITNDIQLLDIGGQNSQEPEVEVVYPMLTDHSQSAQQAELEYPLLTMEQIQEIESLDWDVINSYRNQIDSYAGQEPDALAIDRLCVKQAENSCPYGELYKFVGDVDEPDGTNPASMSIVNFRLPADFLEMVPFNRNKYFADHLVIEFVRNGVLQLKSVDIRNKTFSVEIDLQDRNQLAKVDTISVYLQSQGEVQKPLVSFFNTYKIHPRPLPKLSDPVIKLMFELDVSVDPTNVQEVLWGIKRALNWRIETGLWDSRTPLCHCAWSYFQISMPPCASDYQALYCIAEMLIIPLLFDTEGHYGFTKFPFTIQNPVTFAGGIHLRGPVKIERIHRGPVIYPSFV